MNVEDHVEDGQEKLPGPLIDFIVFVLRDINTGIKNNSRQIKPHLLVY